MPAAGSSLSTPGDGARYVEYLDAQAATPFWQAAKTATIEALELDAPASTALDVGCGTGEEVRDDGGAAGAAVGVDASRVLVEEARRRTGAEYEARFELARRRGAPFRGRSLRRRARRAHAPARRRPRRRDRRDAGGSRGRARASSRSSPTGTRCDRRRPARRHARRVPRAWADSIRNPVGRPPDRTPAAELGAEPCTRSRAPPRSRELAFAEQQYGLAELAATTLNPPRLGPGSARSSAHARGGAFLAAVTYFLVSARKRRSRQAARAPARRSARRGPPGGSARRPRRRTCSPAPGMRSQNTWPERG